MKKNNKTPEERRQYFGRKRPVANIEINTNDPKYQALGCPSEAGFIIEASLLVNGRTGVFKLHKIENKEPGEDVCVFQFSHYKAPYEDDHPRYC